MYPLTWWLQRLDQLELDRDGWKAKCPAHSDRTPSLHINLTNDGEGVLVHCFAGCSYRDIVTAIEDQFLEKDLEVPDPNEPHDSPRRWWEEYTAVPSTFWESIGVRFSATTVDFTWPTTPVMKRRISRKRTFSWVPDGAAAPPLWPMVPESMPERIFICEGESDGGILRFAGLPAWSITKGAALKKTRGVWESLYARGVRTVIFVADYDSAGQSALAQFSHAAQSGHLQTGSLDLGQVVESLLGEKDIRDVWKRVKSIPALRQLVDQSLVLDHRSVERRVDIQQFLSMSIEEQPWLCEPLVLADTVQMIVGAPKTKKSWLALDLGVSIALGSSSKFLGQFGIHQSGPVIYISQEDPDYLLHDRLAKIMISKGAGPRVDLPRLQMPRRNDVPFYLDLTRDFVFDDPHVDSLIEWLQEIKRTHGRIALVIFDPILRMLPQGVDEFKASDIAGSIFRGAEKIRSEMGCGVLLVHHRAKHVTDGKKSYGSVAFHAFAEGTFYILGDGPDKEGWTHVRSEFKSAPEVTWSYRYNDLETLYDVEARSGDEVKPIKTGRADVIRDLVSSVLRRADSEGATVEAINEALPEVPEAQIRLSLRDLEARGESFSELEASVPGRKGGRRRSIWFTSSVKRLEEDFS